MRTKLTVACALAAFVAVTGGTAEATGLIHTSGIAKGAITFDRLSPGVQKMVSAKVTTGTAGAAGTTGTNGVNGAAGLAGAAGPQGSKGDKGDAGMNGTNGTSGLKGDTGWKGDKGAPGTDGKNGTDGTNGVDAPGVVTTHVTGGDSSVCGPDWANDTYTRTLTFVPQDNGTINVIRTYDGTFTTIAGASAPSGPCNSDQVGGVTGTFTGYDVVVVTGGHFFPNATCAANCTSDAMMAAFFPGATRTIDNGWEYHYDAGTHGAWINADSVSRGGNSGNIAG
jgi:Collagen triple helix repeat (20 copies)